MFNKIILLLKRSKKKLNIQRSVIREFMRDISMYRKFNGASNIMSDDLIVSEFKLAILSHAIEKGLSLKYIRKLFGIGKINEALILEKNLKSCSFGSQMLDDSLNCYSSYHLNNADELANLKTFLPGKYLESDNYEVPESQQAIYSKEHLNFLKSRKSVRMFGEDKPDRERLLEAFDVARFAPSQCNRQTSKIYVLEDRDKIGEFLKLQGGAGGFAESVPMILVVASSLKGWFGANQRNQCYVDGGIFSHQLLLALNAVGIETCPLNLALDHERETKIKKLLNIPDEMRLVLSIGAGLAERPYVKVANSRRRSTTELVEFC